jgi:hypothetical protein
MARLSPAAGAIEKQSRHAPGNPATHGMQPGTVVVDRAPEIGARAIPVLFAHFTRACASLGSSPD